MSRQTERTENLGASVVIPCWNVGRLVLDAVRSVLDQGFEPVEIIVVNDGSTEPETLEALDEAAYLPSVRVVSSERNVGVQSSRSLGLRESRCAYVITLDADDELASPEHAGQPDSPSYLRQAISLLEDNEDVAFVHTLSRMFGDFSGLTISAYPLSEAMVVRKHHVPTPIVFRRDDGIAAGLYDPRILKWQDWSFGVALLAARWRRGRANRIAFVNGGWHRYRVRAGTDNLSRRNIDEYSMTLLTVDAFRDYFHHELKVAGSSEEVAQLVLRSKPSRLHDLLYMATFDLQQALRVATERQFDVTSPYSRLGIP